MVRNINNAFSLLRPWTEMHKLFILSIMDLSIIGQLNICTFVVLVIEQDYEKEKCNEITKATVFTYLFLILLMNT